MSKCKISIILIAAFSLVAGCKETQIKQSDFTPFKRPITLSTTTGEVEKRPWEYEISPHKEVMKEEEKKKKIPDEFTYPEERKKPEPALKKPEYIGDKIDISFNFDNAEMKDVIHVILGEILKVNYILDRRVGGTINLHATGQVYKEELISILNTLLYVYDFAIIKDGDIYRVLPRAESRQETNIVIFGDKIPHPEKDIIIQIVPLQYESAKNLSGTIRPFMTGIGNIVTHGDSNYLILVEHASNMAKLLTLIKTFDTPFFAGKAVRIYDFKYADPRNMAKDLTTIVQSLGGKVGNEGEFNFIPFTESNKMIVVSRIPELLAKLDLWIQNIDVPPSELEEDIKVYVYKVQHQKADTIAPVLTQLYSEKMSAQPKPFGKKQLEAMKIIADPKTNSIIIKALPSDYKSMKAIIEAIDATPQQVFIEALIIEVGLNSSLDYGTEWLWDMGQTQLFGFGDMKRTAETPTMIFEKGNFEILLDILATKSDVRILSAPHLLVKDEQSANIQVGSEVPILSSSGQQAGTTVTFEQVQYRDTGIILTVTPHIAENDFISLDIKQEVSDAETTTTGVSDSPTFSTRNAETSLVIKSGHTVSLGGIIQQKDEKSVSKIPLLGDIPYLGNLFKSTSIKNTRTELLMLITPYVANNAEEADTLTDAFQKKLKEIEPLLTQRNMEVDKY